MFMQLTAIHWLYLLFMLGIFTVMLLRRDITVICVIGIFTVTLVATSSLLWSLISVFNGFIYAAKQLVGTILLISIMTAMSKVLIATGINEQMIKPFERFIKTPSLAYWGIGILTMVISWFFWPSTAIAIIGSVLLPIAVRAGLPPIGVAMSMNLFGYGIALSSDFIIQGTPKLTADAAGITVSSVIISAIPLVVVMGAVTTISSFYFLMKDLKRDNLSFEKSGGLLTERYLIEEGFKDNKKVKYSTRLRKLFSLLIPALFLLDIVIILRLKLQCVDATALMGGTSIFILIIISGTAYRKASLEKITHHFIEGLTLGIKVFGPVIPIAAFFYLGDSGIFDIIGKVLPQNSQGILNDLGTVLANTVHLNSVVAAITLTGAGAVIGFGGFGFSGLSLAGSAAKLFSTSLGGGTATLTALGQIVSIWIGGGTLIPWALMPAAAICGVNPLDMVRRNLKPVLLGLAATTLTAILIL